MESRVETVRLGDWGDVSLDIRALTQYSGQGKCWRGSCSGDTAVRYREDVNTWARRIHWTEDLDMNETFICIFMCKLNHEHS